MYQKVTLLMWISNKTEIVESVFKDFRSISSFVTGVFVYEGIRLQGLLAFFNITTLSIELKIN